MAIIRATSYVATFTTTESPDKYTEILVTVAQNGTNLISKRLSNSALEVSGDDVVLKLDQSETKLFTAGEPAFVQIRCYAERYDAPGSELWRVEVFPSLDEVILP